MRRMTATHLLIAVAVVVACLLFSAVAHAAPATLPAAEQTIGRWLWWPIWARDANSAQCTTDEKVRREGRASVRIEHTGKDDWALNPKSYDFGERAFKTADGSEIAPGGMKAEGI
jgi:hypothetical protein